MRILILAPQWPDPPRQGAAIRNLHIAQYLARRHRVTLLSFAPDGPIHRDSLDAVCAHTEVLPPPIRTRRQRLITLVRSSLPDMAWRLNSPAMEDRVLALCAQEQFDAIHIEGIEMARYALTVLELRRVELMSHAPRLVYDAHNAEYLLQRKAFTTDVRQWRRLPGAFYSLVQWWRLRRFERDLCLACSDVIAVSQADKRALARLAPRIGHKIKVLPNGVDFAYWSEGASYPAATEPDTPVEETLVFDGTMDFRPNIDAVVWFCREVWPLLRLERPEMRFSIVGRNPTGAVRALADLSGVTVVGAVEDPRTWVARATVYVVPMRMGGGVRLKVLQAMALGRAVVSTTMGAEGIDAEDGRHLLLADAPALFARAILSLLADPSRRASLGSAARELAAERYAWPGLLPVLDEIYND